MKQTNNLSKYIITSINRNFITISVFLILMLVGAQFVILATLGTKGAEIASIRQKQEILRISNEHLLADIDKSKTLSKIEDGLYNAFELEQTNINVINSYSGEGTNVVGFEGNTGNLSN
jgi:hypothetical protein